MSANTVLLAEVTGMPGGRIAHHLRETEAVALRLLVCLVAHDPKRHVRRTGGHVWNCPKTCSRC